MVNRQRFQFEPNDELDIRVKMISNGKASEEKL